MLETNCIKELKTLFRKQPNGTKYSVGGEADKRNSSLKIDEMSLKAVEKIIIEIHPMQF